MILGEFKNRLMGLLLLGAIIFLGLLGSAGNLSGQNGVICTYHPDSVLLKSGLRGDYDEDTRHFMEKLQAKIATRTNCFPINEAALRQSEDSTAREEIRRLEQERGAVIAEAEAELENFAKSELAKTQERMEQAADVAGKKCGCMATWPKSMVLFGPTYDLSKEVIANIRSDSSQ